MKKIIICLIYLFSLTACCVEKKVTDGQEISENQYSVEVMDICDFLKTFNSIVRVKNPYSGDQCYGKKNISGNMLYSYSYTQVDCPYLDLCANRKTKTKNVTIKFKAK